MIQNPDNQTRFTETLSGPMSQVGLLAGQSLSAAHLQVWTEIVEQNPDLHSPFFRPEFTQLLAQHRTRIEVAIIRNAYQIVGFFPFRRVSPVVGQPVGGRLSGAEGVLCRRGIQVPLEELLDRCQLNSFDFEQVPDSQVQFQHHSFNTTDSHYIDLTSGFDAYCQQKKDSGSNALQNCNRWNANWSVSMANWNSNFMMIHQKLWNS
ncbi:MAG: hypothetical protein R3C11_19390 [Planctomycetaceae bacterium]